MALMQRLSFKGLTRPNDAYLVCPQYDAMDLMSTRNHLIFYARVKGIRDVKANVDYLMAKLGLTAHARTQAAKLSGGNKRKLMLAIALMGTPSILVLDEPTSAMDAVAKRQFWKVIQEIAEDRSILLTVSLLFLPALSILCFSAVQRARMNFPRWFPS